MGLFHHFLPHLFRTNPSLGFVVLFLGSLVTGLAGIGTFNGWVNPYGQYGEGLLPTVVQDSRTEKTDLFENLTRKPEGLILGSSRTMKFESSYLEEKTSLPFFNYGVNHGRPEDFLAILRLYHERYGSLPKMVVMGVDIAALNDKIPADARLSSEPRLFRHIQAEIPWYEEFDRFSQLITMHQTKSSLRSMARYLSGRSRCSDSCSEIVFDPDGVIQYTKRQAEISQGSYDFEGPLRFNQHELQAVFSNFDTLSKTRKAYLQEAILFCESQGCDVYLFTTVHHPRLRDYLRERTKFLDREREAVRWLKQLAAANNVRFVDFGDVEQFDGEAVLFVDGIHPLEANTRRMIDRLLTEPSGDRYALQ